MQCGQCSHLLRRVCAWKCSGKGRRPHRSGSSVRQQRCRHSDASVRASLLHSTSTTSIRSLFPSYPSHLAQSTQLGKRKRKRRRMSRALGSHGRWWIEWRRNWDHSSIVDWAVGGDDVRWAGRWFFGAGSRWLRGRRFRLESVRTGLAAQDVGIVGPICDSLSVRCRRRFSGLQSHAHRPQFELVESPGPQRLRRCAPVSIARPQRSSFFK